MDRRQERRFPPDCDASRPFFLVSSFIHPHPPFAPPAPWNKMYRTVSDDPYMPEDPAEFAAFMSDRFTLDKVGISRQDLSLLAISTLPASPLWTIRSAVSSMR